ncbi:DUF3224 domain-containing protein [Massilia sp. YMA4]|uniref:DUF3224 domain-containing protein n=1 Tax=Massilia sp. YMA4 TaxID=1593482 RepID=UPI000DD14006|nr:DUF3224 domain-containing protein [Massilia sp. YMA4]AXA90270.1 DUF3224 domain-containing protein [Massilia sp. YMA4]
MTSSSATGTFAIAYTPAGVWAGMDETCARMTFRKTYAGALAGTSDGTMLTAGDPATGNAGYVAMERFTGTLAGRSGSFVLQHAGTMRDRHDALHVLVTPGSGTEELAGIAGTMAIAADSGGSRYTFDFTLTAYSA